MVAAHASFAPLKRLIHSYLITRSLYICVRFAFSFLSNNKNSSNKKKDTHKRMRFLVRPPSGAAIAFRGLNLRRFVRPLSSAASTSHERLRVRVKEWLEIDFDESTRASLEASLASDDAEELERAMGSKLEFGTAGLRGEMGPGSARMNELTVLQAAQGLAAHLESAHTQEELRTLGVAVGYDHRAKGTLNSERFAHLTASALLAKGIRVHLYSRLVATPLVPFAVEQRGCLAGVMVTASHNPKDDNGFKVYASSGAQICPPLDAHISDAIEANRVPWIGVVEGANIDTIRASPLCEDPADDLIDGYIDAISSKLCNHKSTNGSSDVKVTYTAMHGVGTPFVTKAFDAFGLPAPVLVPSQIDPDPDFPTVEYPNPEEGDGALALAYETAEAAGSNLILANDPDADRLAVAERRPDGTWKVFSGNEIGAMLGYWMLLKHRESDKGAGSKVAMVGATVSSKMLRAIGEKEGFLYEETLTGFKWMGNRSAELRKEGYDVVFSFEQAIGFCLGDVVKDKDGVSAAAVFAEMAGQLGCSCEDHLEHLRSTYGYFEPNEDYVIVKKREIIDAVFDRLRNNGRYWLSCRGYKIANVRDLKAPGYDSSTPDGKPTLPVGSSEMITYTFENGFVLTFRPSGTEPKLKYYAEGRGEDPAKLKKDVDAFVKEVVLSEMLKPAL